MLYIKYYTNKNKLIVIDSRPFPHHLNDEVILDSILDWMRLYSNGRVEIINEK